MSNTRDERRRDSPYGGGVHDRAALELAARLAERTGAHVTVLHVVPPGRAPHDPRSGVAALVEPMGPERVTLEIVERDDPLEAAVESARGAYDLIVIGASADWGLEPRVFGTQHERLAEVGCSMLIVRRSTPEAAEAARVSARVPAVSAR